MKCKVTLKSRKDNERFQKLSEKFGQIIALESMFDSDGSASIEGYTSDVEVSNRINALSFMVLNNLRQEAGGLSALDLRDSDLTKSKIEKALDMAYSNVESIAEQGLDEYLKGTKSEGAYIAQKAYVVLKTFDQLAPKIKERLSNYGLKLSDIDSDVSAELYDENKESTDKEHIYSQGATEKSRLDTVPPQIKLYIATISKKKYISGENGVEVVDVLDDIGMKQPIDFNETYSMLSKSLANITTYERMLEKLRELGEEIPYIQDIYEDLENNLMESDFKIKLKGKILKPFKSAFYSAFRNTYNKFITVTTRTKEVSEEGAKVKKLISQVLDTNRRRLSNTLKKNWAQTYKGYSRVSKEDKEVIWNHIDEDGDSMKDFFSKGKLKSNIKRLDRTGNKEILHKISKFLNTMGIDVSVEALSQMRKSYNRNKKDKKFGEKIMTDAGSVKNLLEGFWVENKNTFEEENTLIEQLARYESEVSKDRTGGSFMNGEDNMVYPINVPTAASDLFDEFKEKSERLADFAKDSMFGLFHIIKSFQKNNKMDMANFDTTYNSDKKVGTPFNSLDPLSSMATRLKLHMNYSGKSKADKSHGWYMVPTPADRSGSRIFKMPKLKDTMVTVLGIKSGDFKQWLLDTAQAELNRIVQVRQEFDEAVKSGNTSKLIDNYHTKKGKLGNGGYFNSYPELNTLLEEVGPENLDIQSNEVWELLEEAAIAQIEADIDYLAEIGLIKAPSDYESLQLTEFAEKFMPKGAVKTKEIYSFVVNGIVANHELSHIFNGDLAHFKATDFTSGDVNQKGQMSNANKRAGLADTPGVKLNTSEGGANPTFRAAFVNDAIDSSEFAESYKESMISAGMDSKTAETHAKKYSTIEVTDGQGLVSLDRYADILSGLGSLTPSMAQTIQELKKDPKDINWDLVTEVLQPIKGFLQGQRLDENYGRIMPKNLKYSLFPMIPANLVGNPTMQEIHSKMVDKGIDEVVFSTASKFGAYNTNNISDESFDYVDLSNEDWRMPQVVPYKTKTMENFGTQIRKLIMGNIVQEAMYGNKSGKQLQEDYQKAISGNMKDSLLTLVDSLSENGAPAIKKIAKKVLADVARNAYKSTPDFIERALEVIELADGSQDTRIPMSFPAIKHRVESSLNSAIRKAVTKQSIPGFSAVQYTGLGFNKGNIKTSKGLKFVRKSKDGKVLPAEVKVSPQYFINSLKAKKALAVKENPALLEAIDNTISQLQQGVFDLSNFKDEVLEGIIYRIPYQAKNSSIPIKIVEITPEAQGSTICIPSEITIQSGSDYDIDKIYMELRHFDLKSNGTIDVVSESLNTREGRDNMIVNTHFNILTSPEHFAELVLPNHSDTLDKLSEEAEERFGSETENRKWSSISTQDDFRDKNQAGGIMIGVFSIANTAHALFQELGVTLKSRAEGTVQINGEEVTSLSQTKNRNGGLISDDHMENQTAAVDNASNPVLGNLNINTITAPVYNFLIEAGTGIEYAAKLVGSPIIRELTKEVRKFETLYGPEGAFKEALKLVSEKHGIDTDIINEEDIDVTEAILDEALTTYDAGGNTTIFDADILGAFLTFRKYGQDLVQVLQALQTDNVGAHQTLAANFIHSEKLAKIKGTRANEMKEMQYPTDTIDTISTIELDREKYRNHSMEAFELYGLESAINLVGAVIDDTKPVQQKVLRDYASSTTKLVDRDLRLLMNDFYSFIYINPESGLSNTNAVSDWLDSETKAELLVGEESVGKRVLELQEEERARSLEDVTYIPNEFIMSLTVELANEDTGFDLVNFNNTISRALSSEQKTTLSNELLRLLNSENVEESELAQDLVLYNLSMDGFNRNTNSFGDYIHSSIYESIKLNDKSLVDFYRDSRDEFMDISSIDTDTFLNMFLRNRAAELKGIPDLSKRKRSDVRNYLKENPHIKYFKINNVKGKLSVSESRQDGSGKFDSIGEPLGNSNIHVEYQIGDPMHTLEDIQDVLKSKQISEDVQSEGDC